MGKATGKNKPADEVKRDEKGFQTEISEVAKITPGMLGKPSRAKAENKEIAIARIFGIANGIKVVKAPNGDIFEALKGNFEAYSLEDGVVLTSGILYLPTGIHDRVLAQLKDADEGTSIQFGIELAAIPASNPQGYSWKATAKVKQDRADPLAELRKMTIADAKLLPAPAKA